MMYNTKLNEFSLEQLNALQFIVDEKIAEINQKLHTVSQFAEGSIKTDIESALNKGFDTFILWKVQLENAKSDINEMNKINAG